MIWGSPTRHRTIWGKPGFIHKANTSPQCQMPRRRAFAHSSWLRRQTAVRSRPRRGRQARRWAVLWWSVEKISGCGANCCVSWSHHSGEEAGCGSPGMAWWHMAMPTACCLKTLTSSAQFKCYIAFNEGATTATCLISCNVNSQIKEGSYSLTVYSLIF